MSRSSRIKATAYHEAGHAVVAWRTGLKFKHVTIKPNANDGSLGHLLHSQFPRWFRPDVESSGRVSLLVKRHIITSFAGQIAEARFRGKRPRYGFHHDNRNAVDLAFRLGGSRETVEAYLKYCFLAARDGVNANWQAIEVVAAGLLERGTLSYEDVIEVIAPGSAALRDRLRAGLAAQRKRRQETT